MKAGGGLITIIAFSHSYHSLASSWLAIPYVSPTGQPQNRRAAGERLARSDCLHSLQYLRMRLGGANFSEVSSSWNSSEKENKVAKLIRLCSLGFAAGHCSNHVFRDGIVGVSDIW